MRTRRVSTGPHLAIVLGISIWLPAMAERIPTFEEIYRTSDPQMLTAWARRYERGVGVGRDTKKAVRLYCRAARKGDVDAKYYLGQLYAFGGGIEKDQELAAAWVYEAAQGKHPRAGGLLNLLKVKAKPKRKAVCPLEGGDTLVSRPHPASGEIAKLVRTLAPGFRLDPNLVLAVVEVESGFNPKAISPKNAQGLMQLIPETAERFGVENVWDPEQNLRGGMAYLRWLLDYFDGDIKLALAGYNAGEKAVERHGGVPPYEETQLYVKRILRRLGMEDGSESS